MKNYKDSDYAVNKYSQNIVYRFQNERIEISLKDYLSENPDKTEEDFKELKMLSDEMFHEQVKKEYNQTRLNSPINQFENITVNANWLLEDEYIEKLDKHYSKKALASLFESGQLTTIQSRRFKKYIIDGYSLREIAAQEGTSHIAIFKSVKYSTEKLINFFNL